MLGKDPFELVFATGVARFDAHGNLFVNLPHSDDEPQDVTIGGRSVAAPEKRARVHGTVPHGEASGAFDACADLPRGLTIEVKGYRSAHLVDGRLRVQIEPGATIPDWFASGKEHLFAGATPLRLWAKSSLPEGVALAGADGVDHGPPTAKKPVARAQFQPVSSVAPPPPPGRPAAEVPASRVEGPAPARVEEAPAPPREEPGTKGDPYRPERLAAGHHHPQVDGKKSALGCSTLVATTLLLALAALAAL